MLEFRLELSRGASGRCQQPWGATGIHRAGRQLDGHQPVRIQQVRTHFSMKGVLLAWMTALTISTVDSLRAGKGTPVPGVLVGDSVIMAVLGLVAEVAPTPAALAAWGFLIAAVIASPQVIPPGLKPTTPAAAPAA